jgi:K+-sensing histidine kinase KdpD
MPADRFFQRHRAAVLVVSFLAPLVACALLALVREAIDNTNAALILVLLVVAAAATGLRLAGLLAAASSAAWFDFFLTAP